MAGASSSIFEVAGTPLALFIIQVVFIIILARVLGKILRIIKQPMVISEILSGILLGPTALGHIPGFSAWLFPANSMPILNTFANIGLLFFMFLIGLELDPTLLKTNAKTSLWIASASIVTPFGLGSAVSYYLYDNPLNADLREQTPFASFLIFIGAAMSITAFPVLARILAERKLMSNKVGVLTLSCAAVNDVVGWILLAFSISIVRAASPLSVLWTLLLAVGFIAFMVLVLRRLLIKGLEKFRPGEHVSQNMVVVVFLLLFVCSWMSEAIGIHAMFGAFTLGAIMPKEKGLDHKLAEKIEDIVVLFLLPLYFVYSGLRTQLGVLNNGGMWGMAFLVLAAACTGKIVGAGLMARVFKLSNRESVTVGVLMNTRGLVELIVLNIGLDLKVITPTVFAVMVLMTLVTTFATTPLLNLIYPPSAQAVTDGLRKHRDPNKYRILLCVSDMLVGTNMVTLTHSLCAPQRMRGKAYALRLVRLSERPSTYMRYRYDPDDSVSLSINERAKALGLPIKFDAFASSSYSSDILHEVKQHEPEFVLLGWDKPDRSPEEGTLIAEVLRSVTTTAGVLIPRNMPIEIRRVLFPYHGGKHDQQALLIANRMSKAKGAEIVILTTKEVREELSAAEQTLLKKSLGLGTIRFQDTPPNMSIMEEACVQVASSSQPFHLVMFSTGSDWSKDRTSPIGSNQKILVEKCGCSVLIVHDPTRVYSNDLAIQMPEEKEQEMQDMISRSISMDIPTMSGSRSTEPLMFGGARDRPSMDTVSSTSTVIGPAPTIASAFADVSNIDEVAFDESRESLDRLNA